MYPKTFTEFAVGRSIDYLKENWRDATKSAKSNVILSSRKEKREMGPPLIN